MMNFDQFPPQTKAYRQWVVWRFEARDGAKDTKVLYNPHSRAKASVTDPSTWVSFGEAVAALEAQFAEFGCAQSDSSQPGIAGIGFVLTDFDPFAVIDLDNVHGDKEARARQDKIYNSFKSYSELSPSGEGCHIWLEGKVPHGRKRSFVEVYSSERYMTVTGKAIRPGVDILAGWDDDQGQHVNGNELLNILWEEMGGPAATYVYGEKQDQEHTDEEVIDIAMRAANGDKFARLMAGHWHGEYPSQSEADLALMNILAYYSQNRAQLMRLFRQSALGERDKASRDRYLDYCINRAFDRNLPPLDMEGLLIAFKNMVAANPAQHVYVNAEPVTVMAHLPGQGAGQPGGTPAPLAQSGHASEAAATGGLGAAVTPTAPSGQGSPYSAPDASPFPPGLLGDVAAFIYEAAPRPVHDIALAGAIGFLAGITGRAYNVSGTGLNQYVLTLAPTGTGKEAISGGTDKLIEAVLPTCPTAQEFRGPGEIVSSAGLIKWLAGKPACYAIVGEFGLKLAEMSSPKANPHLSSVKRVLLDLFHKSGHGASMQPMAYSDKDKNTPAINSPSFTLIGESVPERFYEVLDEGMIADGLLPRFTIVEYVGKRPPRNDNAKNAKPSLKLIDRLGSVIAQCQGLAARQQVHDVPLSGPAHDIFDLFDKWCDQCINDENATEVTRQLWNRAHIKALKLAALVAVGINYIDPLIDEHCARWATDMVAKQTNRLLAKFLTGDIGDGAGNEARQVREVVKVIATYLTEPFEKYSQYGGDREMHRAGVIRYDHIQRRLVSMACFRLDRIGATNAIKRAIDLLLTADELREVPKLQMQSQFGKSPRAFMVSDPERFRV